MCYNIMNKHRTSNDEKTEWESKARKIITSLNSILCNKAIRREKTIRIYRSIFQNTYGVPMLTMGQKREM